MNAQRTEAIRSRMNPSWSQKKQSTAMAGHADETANALGRHEFDAGPPKQAAGTNQEPTRESGAPTLATRKPMHARRLEQLLTEPIEYIDHPLFRTPKKLPLLMQESLPAAEVPLSPRKVPAGTPPYLASLYQTRLLSPADESWAFCRMNYLKYQAEKLRRKIHAVQPSPELLDELQAKLSAAEEIRNLLVHCNLRLVVSIAKKFVSPDHNFDDLVSDGNISLLRAVEKFDFSLGYRFSTYATHTIRRNYFRPFRKQRAERAKWVSEANEWLSSLAEDSAAKPPEHESLRVSNVLQQIVGQLDEREQLIVRSRFALDGQKKPLSLMKIGRMLNLSKERIRQLLARALEKLRAAAEANHVTTDFLECKI